LPAASRRTIEAVDAGSAAVAAAVVASEPPACWDRSSATAIRAALVIADHRKATVTVGILGTHASSE